MTLTDEADQGLGDAGRVGQEGAPEPDGAQLYGAAERGRRRYRDVGGWGRRPARII